MQNYIYIRKYNITILQISPVVLLKIKSTPKAPVKNCIALLNQILPNSFVPEIFVIFAAVFARNKRFPSG